MKGAPMASTTTRPTAPSRLPSTRESRPALIGLALVLIVGGALASAYLAVIAGHRAEFVQVRTEIAQGQKITKADLQTVSLPQGYDGGIPADQEDSLVGQSTTVRLLAGTVLTPAMVSKTGGIAADQAQVALNVDPMTAQGMHPGDRVLVYVEDDDGGTHTVDGELLAIGKSQDGGLTGTSSSQVPIKVLIARQCLTAVSQGIIGNKFAVSQTGGSGPLGCGQ
ncbi:hypothetical protein GCM10028772_33580 [Nocardioides ultimimeridianus]